MQTTRRGPNVPEQPRSKKFSPSFVTEKLVPVLLILLLIVLLTVFVVIGLSAFGVIPAT
jgi:hypothetical protein